MLGCATTSQRGSGEGSRGRTEHRRHALRLAGHLRAVRQRPGRAEQRRQEEDRHPTALAGQSNPGALVVAPRGSLLWRLPMAEPESPEPIESAPRTGWHLMLERYHPTGFKLYPESLLMRGRRETSFVLSRRLLVHGVCASDPVMIVVFGGGDREPWRGKSLRSVALMDIEARLLFHCLLLGYGPIGRDRGWSGIGVHAEGLHDGHGIGATSGTP